MPSRLDTKETSVTKRTQATYRGQRLTSCSEEMDKIRLIYFCLDDSEDTPSTQRLDSCMTQAWYIRHKDTGIVKIAANQCHVRFCPLCSSSRQAFLTSQVSAWLETTDHPKLLTVTLKHSNAPLSWQIKNLYDYFRKFRRRSYLKKRITGGVWFFQVHKAKSDNLWHAHIHAMIDGDFLEHEKLKQLWIKITYTSHVVDIKSIKDPDNAARHVARYAARPASIMNLNLEDACELVGTMRHVRLIGTWGTARKISLRPKKPDDADKQISLGSWTLIHHMLDVSSEARAILHAFEAGTSLPEGISMRPLERSIDGQLEDFNKAPPNEYQPTFFDRKEKYDQCSQSRDTNPGIDRL